MRRYQNAERMIRGITWQCKMELYAVLLLNLKRKDTTEHDLQNAYDKHLRAELMQANGASERQIETMLKEFDEMSEYKTYGPLLEPSERVTALKQELAEAEAALAAKNERDALAAKIDAEIALAEATRTLLADIRILRLTDNQTHRRKEFAVYRKELAALAASYDVKIVLVGDKSAAVLVLN